MRLLLLKCVIAANNFPYVRGFFPTSTCLRMMALTATATEQTRKEIFKLLGLKKPSLVLKSPDKPNITYHVCDKLDIENVFNPLAEEVCIKRSSMDRTIIFCRSYDQCSEIYLTLKSRLGSKITDPVEVPGLARFRLVDVYGLYHKKCQKSHLKVIL